MPAPPTLAPARPAVVAPLAPERYKIQFTASREVHDKLRRAQDLLRHAIPDGDVSAVFDRALTMLVEELERRKLAAAARPRAAQSLTSGSRDIPAAISRLVWARDAGQCTFIGTQGRCTERGLLEFHHLVPFAAGGETSADNLAVRCRAHNQWEAEEFFDPLFAREARAGYTNESARSGTSRLPRPNARDGRGSSCSGLQVPQRVFGSDLAAWRAGISHATSATATKSAGTAASAVASMAGSILTKTGTHGHPRDCAERHAESDPRTIPITRRFSSGLGGWPEAEPTRTRTSRPSAFVLPNSVCAIRSLDGHRNQPGRSPSTKPRREAPIARRTAIS